MSHTGGDALPPYVSFKNRIAGTDTVVIMLRMKGFRNIVTFNVENVFALEKLSVKLCVSL